MRDIVFRAGLFSSERDRKRSEMVLRILLNALVEVNLDYLDQYPNTPRIYSAGVRYQAEQGTEEWKAIPDCIRDGEADCEDLASWKTAEDIRDIIRRHTNAPLLLSYAQMKAQGAQFPRPHLKWKKLTHPITGKPFYLYHVQEIWPSGLIDDPSRVLGMKGR
jgi:hypothetical protein